MRAYHLFCIIMAGLLFVSCTAAPAVSAVPSLTPHMYTTQVPADSPSRNSAAPINTLDSSEITPLPAEINPFVRLVEEDLASHLQIPTNQIHFLKISDIDWQDINQGCTTPASQIATKGRISGYRVWLEAHGKDYLYHIGLDNTIVFCTQQ